TRRPPRTALRPARAHVHVGTHRRGRGAPQGGGSARIAELRVCRVQPDLPAVARAFDYLVPEDAAGIVRVGTIVRVPLHGRRVRGWVVADGVEPEAERSDLRPLVKVVSAGPPSEVVELCRWAAWRYAGPFPLLLRSASPPNVVPPAADPELHAAVFPPHAAPDGVDTALVPGLSVIVVLDEGDEALKEERAPAWNARELALERARRAGARCTLVSPAPTLEAEASVGPPARPARPFERDGWPRVDVIDLR